MFDAHVHAAPDVVDRRTRDLALAEEYKAAGWTGFVLKAHYESTVGRAAAVADATGLRVFGGVVLNAQAGGINPNAVEACLRAGGRVVWMPSADSRVHRLKSLPSIGRENRRLVFSTPPVDFEGVGDVLDVLALIAEHDAVLASGHLSQPEIEWLVGAARDAGVQRVMLTHPAYTVPAMDPDAVARLADLGAHVEITAYQLLHQPGISAETLARYAAVVPPSRLILTSDVGQVESPDAPTAIGRLISALAAEGIDEKVLLDAASIVPTQLVTS